MRLWSLVSALGLCVVAMSLGSCVTPIKRIEAKVNILKKEGGQAIAVSNSFEEGIAWEGAKMRAEEHCFRNGKKDFIVVDESSNYQGEDKTTKGVAGVVGAIFKGGKSDKQMDDYKVKLTFKCDGNYTGKGEPFATTL